MRLSQFLVVVAASFLFTSEALSATTDSNQAKIAKVASPGGPSHRLLRAHHTSVEEEDDSEERAGGFDKFSSKHQDQLIAYAESLGIDLKKATNDQHYFNQMDKKAWKKYNAYFNEIQAKSRKHKAPMITYE